MVDIKDRRILFELEKNCRQPVSQIAKLVGLSKSSVIYRINKLAELGVIDSFATTINPVMMGYDVYTILIKLQNSKWHEKEELLRAIKSLPRVGWCVVVFGSWDIVFSILSKDIVELQKVLNKIEQDFHTEIKEKEVLFNTEIYSYARKHIYSDLNVDASKLYSHHSCEQKKVELSDNDLKIINQVKKSPTSSIRELAENTKLSVDTVKRSLKRLVELNVISRFRVRLNTLELGCQWNLILLSLKGVTKEQKAKIIQYTKENPNFISVVNCVGKWNYVFSIDSKSNKEFEEIYWSFRSEFEDLIKNEEVLSVARKHKHFFDQLLKLD